MHAKLSVQGRLFYERSHRGQSRPTVQICGRYDAIKRAPVSNYSAEDRLSVKEALYFVAIRKIVTEGNTS